MNCQKLQEEQMVMDTPANTIFDVMDPRFRLLLGMVKAESGVSPSSVVVYQSEDGIPRVRIIAGECLVVARLRPVPTIESAVRGDFNIYDKLHLSYVDELAKTDPTYKFMRVLSDALRTATDYPSEERAATFADFVRLADLIEPQGIDFLRNKTSDILGAAVSSYVSRSMRSPVKMDEGQIKEVARVMEFVSGQNMDAPLTFTFIIDIVPAFYDACKRIADALEHKTNETEVF